MPQYVYVCQPDLGGCGHEIEFECLMSELDGTEPKSCPSCHKRKPIQPKFFVPNPLTCNTVGSLADRNTSKLSNDEKAHIKEQNYAYRSKGVSWESTPEGMVHKNANKST